MCQLFRATRASMFSFKYFSFLAVSFHPSQATSHHPPKMPGWRGMLYGALLSGLISLLTESHSHGVVNFCPTTAPLLAAREDLGDTKQEDLNKWKLWMFILSHSSSPKTSQRSQDPTSETRLFWLGVPCSHWKAVSVPWCEWSRLDGTRQGGPPTPTGWLPPSFLTVLKEPGNELTPFCQLVTLGESFLKYSVDCRSRSHKSCSLRIYQDQVAPD